MRVAAIVIALAIAIAATMDEEESDLFYMQYCNNVAEGSWGNYRPEIDCGESK